jgi:hypothetical protein
VRELTQLWWNAAGDVVVIQAEGLEVLQVGEVSRELAAEGYVVHADARDMPITAVHAEPLACQGRFEPAAPVLPIVSMGSIVKKAQCGALRGRYIGAGVDLLLLAGCHRQQKQQWKDKDGSLHNLSP